MNDSNIFIENQQSCLELPTNIWKIIFVNLIYYSLIIMDQLSIGFNNLQFTYLLIKNIL